MPKQQVTKQSPETQTVNEKRWFYTNNICCYLTTTAFKFYYPDTHTSCLIFTSNNSSAHWHTEYQGFQFFVQSKPLEEH